MKGVGVITTITRIKKPFVTKLAVEPGRQAGFNVMVIRVYVTFQNMPMLESPITLRTFKFSCSFTDFCF